MTDPSRKNQELIEEITILADIGRLINSTLNIDKVYERFAAETQKLILFDSLTINLYDFHEKTMCVGYVSGLDIDGRRQGDPLVLEGSLSEAVINSRTSLIIQPESIDEIVGRFPRLSPIFQAGLRSIMCIPLVFRDEVIGVLHFRSKKQNAYTEQDLRLAERILMQITGAIANTQLYSDLRKTEKSLRESEERYHRIADAVTDYIFTAYIEDGKVVKTVHGTGCIAITGYSTEEFAADPYLWFSMVVPEDHDRVKKYASRILTGKHLDPVEHRIRRKDGRVRWVLNTPVPYHDSSGALLSYDGLITDITLRKRAEEALLKSKQQYDNLVANIPVGVYIMRSTPGGAFAFNYVSPRVAEMFNVSAENFLADPQTGFQPIHPDDLDALVKLNQEVFQQPQPFNWEGRAVVNGAAKWFSISSSPELLENGDVLWHGVVADITELKRVEKEKEKLEAQNRQLQKAESLGRMAGAIAHHFNNQLGVVIGNLEMAIDDLPQGAGPVNSLTAAMNASLRAAEISGLMLTYLGQSSGKHEPLDLSEACLRSLPILRAAMPGKFLLENDFPTPGPIIRANANHIQQVLTNLITNAREALAEDAGSIHMSVKTVSPADIPAAYRHPMDWQPQEHAYACMEVADKGCGIADKDIEKLFDPFFSSKFAGRGMGLAVVLGIVRAHGGVVTVESEPGRGSIFRVFFPVTDVNRDTLPQGVPIYTQGVPITPSPIMPAAGSGTILLVEDEEMVRDMAAAMLTRLGFTVLEAKDGVEAVELFRQYQDEIRCVLCDLTMPRMDGWETLTALRQLAPDLPVILASGYDKAQVMAGDHLELPQAFLGKPYKLKGLGDAIGKALAGGSKRMAV